MPKKFYGVIPPIVTPVDENEKVDENALRRLIRHCIKNGLHGIFVTGSNGECLALTQEERNRAIKIAVEETKGKVPLLAGVMDASTPRVIENIKRFEDMGGEMAVVTPVFYSRHATQDETVRHFEAISKATSVQLVIYNIPPFTGQTLKAETIFKIAQIDKVIGYKDTSGSMPEFIKCLFHFKGSDFVLCQGATNLALPSMLLGADGYIPSLAPLFPKPHIAMYEAGVKGDIAAAKKWGEIVDKTSWLFQMAKSQTSSTKYAISTLGFMNKRPIRPTEPITPEEEKRIDKLLEELREYIS